MTRPKAKITITVDQGVLASVKAAVGGGQAPSVSAYVEHAIVGQLAAEAEFDATIADLLNTTGGEPTDEERAEAQRLLSGTAA
ncbi:MAG TPA: hypothetical protein ENH15_05615 [Actinobacteria bacterium]|nr:hypothetical protein [Actinomycetota bacterium]